MRVNKENDGSASIHGSTNIRGGEVMNERQRLAFRLIAEAFEEAIGAAGSQGIPSGHLYAMVMGKTDLATYEAIIGSLKATGRIVERNHVLRVNRRD
jgi:hypothetical protein